jgi:hypothetical protein
MGNATKPNVCQWNDLSQQTEYYPRRPALPNYEMPNFLKLAKDNYYCCSRALFLNSIDVDVGVARQKSHQ